MSMEKKRAHCERHPGGLREAAETHASAGDTSTRATPHRYRRPVHIVWTNDPELLDIPRQGVARLRPQPLPFPADANPDVAGVGVLQVEVEDPGEPGRLALRVRAGP